MSKQYLNYIGSKHTLLPFLDEVLQDLGIEDSEIRFGDLCAGAGSVSNFVNNKYKNTCIASNDIEYYSYVINYASLNTNYSSFIEEIIVSLNSLDGIRGLISKNYTENRMFFSKENGLKIDAMRERIEVLYTAKKITYEEYMFLLASLISSADKVANVACVYGAYLKKIKTSAAKDIILLPIHTKTDNAEKKHIVSQRDILTFDSDDKFDIVYIDPPYNNRQYGANYFPLNYIAHYDETIELRGKTGIFDYFKSSFCQKAKVKKSFEDLVKNLNSTYILISYNDEGLVPIDDLIDILGEYGTVKVYEKEYKRFKSQKSKKNATVTEYILSLNKVE